ncbi:MAG: hypothetical protein ACO1N6_00275 [Microcella sp.]
MRTALSIKTLYSRRPLLVAGLAVLVIGAVAILTIPLAATAVAQALGSDGYPFFFVLEMVTRLVSAIAPPLGSALIVAGLILEPRDPSGPED